jgi:hypothetical protein
MKLNLLKIQQEKKLRYLKHLEHQEQRLNRMAELLEIAPSEVEELLNLILDYWISHGTVTPKGMIRLPKPK